MWRIRAAGGTDSTPVVLSYRPEDAIRAKHVEVFPVEIPRRMREPQPDPQPVAQPKRRPTRGQALVGLAVSVAAAFLLPVVVLLLRLVWGWVL